MTVTPERLARALNTLALCLAKEALLSPEERAQRADEIAAFVRRELDVVDQAAAYLLDALAPLEAGGVLIQMKDPLSQILLHPEKDAEILPVIMPLRL